jgi:hypothetical protein
MEQTFIMIKPDGVQRGLVRGLFPIFLRPELASFRLNLNWVCWSSFVMRGSVYRSKCLVDEKREENDRKRNQISPSYN